MDKDFMTELDELISKHKARSADVGEMIADLDGALAGLTEELFSRDDDAE